jgi:hypothetical protein
MGGRGYSVACIPGSVGSVFVLVFCCLWGFVGWGGVRNLIMEWVLGLFFSGREWCDGAW